MKEQLNDAQKALDKFAVAVDTDRLRREFIEILDEEPFSRFEEWAESLQDIASSVADARDRIDEWAEAEDRETKAEAKDGALEALDRLISACQDSPLEVTELADWVPPED